MKVIEAKYGRKFNLGDYNSEEITISSTIEEGEDVLEVISSMKAMVNKAHIGEAPGAPIMEIPPQDKKPKKQKDSPKVADSDVDGDADPEESGSQDIPVEDLNEIQDKSEKDKEAPSQEAKAKDTKEKPKRRTKVGGTFSKKIDLHRKLLRVWLDEESPGWADNVKKKSKVSAVSEEMEGVEFLDSDGEILESFKKNFMKELKK